MPVTEEHVGDLVVRAQSAIDGARWLEALDLASQALAGDPGHREAAVLVGTARQRLGTVSAAGAELRQMTVVAVDMARSTTIAARIGAEAMRELMLALYEVCVEAIARYEGRVAKYGGDGVLAQFGHPVAHDDDARRAVLASQAVLESVRAQIPLWKARFGEEVSVRVGIDSGLAAVGPVSDSPWSFEDLSGDPPNVATRVQGTAEPMTIRITDATHKLIAGWFTTEPVGLVELRNYPRPVGLHVVLRETDAETRLEASTRPRAALVDREAELAVLRDAWNSVTAVGERRVVSITGDPGIGKSRLVEHMLETAVASGATRTMLACSTLYRDSPLRPVARALTRFFRVFPHEGGDDALWLDAVRRRLEQLPGRRVPTEDAVPIFGWLLGIRSAVDLPPDELRRAAFEILVDLFAAMAAVSPLLICVEDADTADPSTIELLNKLLERPVRMLMIVTGRSLVATLSAADEVLELSPLSPDAAAELARSVEPDLDERTVLRIVERSDGVPFFAEELARAVGESGRQAQTETVELAGFLTARLDELDPELKQVLRLVAIAGRELSVDLLQKLTAMPGEQLDMTVDELQRRKVIIRRVGPVGDTVHFRHMLLRSAVYESILTARRAQQHHALAELMAGLPPDSVPPEDLANHYELGGDHERAAVRWLDAGRRAAESGSNNEAAELFKRCLSALARLPETSGRAAIELEAQLGLGGALSAIDGYTSPGPRAAFERAVELAEDREDTGDIIRSLYGIWEYWMVLGEHLIAATLAERCLRISEEEPEVPEFRLLAMATSGHQQLVLGNFGRARSELEVAGWDVDTEPLDIVRQDSALASLAGLAVVLWFLGETRASRDVAVEALVRSEALDPAGRRTALTQCFVGSYLAWRAQLDGDPQSAIKLAQRAGEIAAQRVYPTWMAATQLHRSIAECSLGRYEEALPVLTFMVDAWRSAGRDASGRQLHPVLMSPYFTGRLAENLLRTGDTQQAATIIDRTLSETSANGERFWDADLLRLRAEVGHAEGEASELIDPRLEAARALATQQGALALLARVPDRSSLASEAGA